jgi:hypothetical protein
MILHSFVVLTWMRDHVELVYHVTLWNNTKWYSTSDIRRRRGIRIRMRGSRGDHSLLCFAYTCVRDLIIGGVIYLAKNIIRWWYSTCKKHENIICDGILHVNMFHYLKIPILHVHFLQNLPTINILDPIFYRTLFYDFVPVISPRRGCGLTSLVLCINDKICDIRGRNATIRNEIWTTNIRSLGSLGCRDIREWVTLWG